MEGCSCVSFGVGWTTLVDLAFVVFLIQLEAMHSLKFSGLAVKRLKQCTEKAEGQAAAAGYAWHVEQYAQGEEGGNVYGGRALLSRLALQ